MPEQLVHLICMILDEIGRKRASQRVVTEPYQKGLGCCMQLQHCAWASSKECLSGSCQTEASMLQAAQTLSLWKSGF